MELTARIHIEEGSYWADVPELPGCFASGDTLDELFESLQEGVALYLADEVPDIEEDAAMVRVHIVGFGTCPTGSGPPQAGGQNPSSDRALHTDFLLL